ncbi:MAG TPA: alpha/beta hydrolase [Mycobacterium sp.]|nr:alpha/beta hydrolase [Mycobacterium sp.]
MFAMWRMRPALSTLLTFGVAFCVVLPTAVAAPDTGVNASAVPQPNWGSCERWLGNTSDIPTARCATVSVPVDYGDPGAGTAQLAVIRVPASGERVGVLMFNPGGPGASAVDSVAGMAAGLVDTDIGRHFDLVGFDPRGVGHSTPALRCRTDGQFDAYRRDPMVDYSPAGVAHIEDVYRQLVAQCLTRNGARTLANIGTANAARDMDLVRQALGENQINYLGFSYGTELGTAYAQAFGQNIRAMVLDGAVDPTQGAIDANIDQMAAFQGAFDDYARDCAQYAGCPLGDDPAKAVDMYHQLVDPLVAKPGPTSEPRGLSYQDAITGTVDALYTPQYWKLLTSGLLGLQRNTDAGDLLLLADDYWGRNKNGHYSNLQDAFTAVRCVDTFTPTDPAAWVDADRRSRDVAPFMSYGQFTGFAPRDVCAFWPVPPTTTPHEATSPGPGKVVVVSTTHDPATPYQAGVNLARQLDASLITFDGTQHTVVFNGVACVDDAVVNYLLNLTPPPDNLRC